MIKNFQKVTSFKQFIFFSMDENESSMEKNAISFVKNQFNELIISNNDKPICKFNFIGDDKIINFTASQNFTIPEFLQDCVEKNYYFLILELWNQIFLEAKSNIPYILNGNKMSSELLMNKIVNLNIQKSTKKNDFDLGAIYEIIRLQRNLLFNKTLLAHPNSQKKIIEVCTILNEEMLLSDCLKPINTDQDSDQYKKLNIKMELCSILLSYGNPEESLLNQIKENFYLFFTYAKNQKDSNFETIKQAKENFYYIMRYINNQLKTLIDIYSKPISFQSDNNIKFLDLKYDASINITFDQKNIYLILLYLLLYNVYSDDDNLIWPQQTQNFFYIYNNQNKNLIKICFDKLKEFDKSDQILAQTPNQNLLQQNQFKQDQYLEYQFQQNQLQQYPLQQNQFQQNQFQQYQLQQESPQYTLQQNQFQPDQNKIFSLEFQKKNELKEIYLDQPNQSPQYPLQPNTLKLKETNVEEKKSINFIDIIWLLGLIIILFIEIYLIYINYAIIIND